MNELSSRGPPLSLTPDSTSSPQPNLSLSSSPIVSNPLSTFSPVYLVSLITSKPSIARNGRRYDRRKKLGEQSEDMQNFILTWFEKLSLFRFQFSLTLFPLSLTSPLPTTTSYGEQWLPSLSSAVLEPQNSQPTTLQDFGTKTNIPNDPPSDVGQLSPVTLSAQGARLGTLYEELQTPPSNVLVVGNPALGLNTSDFNLISPSRLELVTLRYPPPSPSRIPPLSRRSLSQHSAISSPHKSNLSIFRSSLYTLYTLLSVRFSLIPLSTASPSFSLSTPPLSLALSLSPLDLSHRLSTFDLSYRRLKHSLSLFFLSECNLIDARFSLHYHPTQ